MRKTVVLSLVLLIFSAYSTALANYELLGYSSASSIKRNISNIEYEIKKNDRKISSIKSSDKISQYDKKRQIRELERKNYNLKKQIYKLKSDYKKAIS